MSLFGSLSTAISGLNSQSHALSNIAGNVANSQTTGYKRLDTEFEDRVAQSARLGYVSGAVAAENQATNNIQGTIEQVEDPLSLALGGRGFFSVAKPVTRATDGTVTFDAKPTYSRAGDFKLDRDGYLVNSAGYALKGWVAKPDGTLDRTMLSEINIDRSPYAPTPTSSVSLTANLPANPPSPAPAMSTTTQVYDALGNQHALKLDWVRTGSNAWSLNVTAPDLPAAQQDLGTFNLLFNGAPTSASDPQAGTLRDIAQDPAVPSGTPAGPATISFSPDFGQGAQPMQLRLGSFGSSDGLSQFGGTEYSLRSIAQDGASAGAFSSVAFQGNGDVVVNYDNGQNRVVARAPVVTFANADALDRLDGQAFAATADAGLPQVTDAGRSGAADINIGAVERSNVDIAAEFSKLIVAQRAYTANTRIVTATDEMLQDTINMRR